MPTLRAHQMTLNMIIKKIKTETYHKFQRLPSQSSTKSKDHLDVCRKNAWNAFLLYHPALLKNVVHGSTNLGWGLGNSDACFSERLDFVLGSALSSGHDCCNETIITTVKPVLREYINKASETYSVLNNS